MAINMFISRVVSGLVVLLIEDRFFCGLVSFLDGSYTSRLPLLLSQFFPSVL